MNLNIVTQIDLDKVVEHFTNEIKTLKTLKTAQAETDTIEWVKASKAKKLLDRTSTNTLHKYRREGKIIGKKETCSGHWFYDVNSIKKYRES